MRMFIVNLVLAALWLLLSPEPSLPGFFIGFATGFTVITLFRSALGADDYVRRSIALVRFLVIFTREFVFANLNVARVVLFTPREALHPNFLTYDVSGLSRAEIVVLSYCITLTPGTTTVQIADDFQTVVLHALDAENPELIRQSIDRTLRCPLLRFTR